MAASRTKESGEVKKMAGAAAEREEEPLVADASCVDAKGKERERRVNRDRDRERERDGGTSDNVKVSVRCRPMVEKEQREGHRGVVRVDRLRREVTVQLPSPAQQRVFTYDVVFGPESTQAEVFNETARPIVDSVLQGYNGTIFAYGQTGTGKTHTMVGNKESAGMRGIIPNSFAHIFGHIAQSEGEVRFLVRVSYLEIYNEEVRDLLGKNHQARLEVRERPDIGVYVKDLSSFVVKGPEDMEKLMSIGNRNRAFGATDMNEYSSRSHTIFTITVECGEIGPDHKQHIRMGKLHLVDLAGSERQSKTHATGDRQKEAIKINLSLSTLGNVISALVDGKSTHIPYRNSNLTRLLQDSLGGNSKTVMIANVGPADYNCDETLNTLRYANRAKSIQNKAHINQDPKDAMLKEFQKEIDELRKKLAEASESEGSNSDGCEFEEEGGGRNGRKAQNKSKRIMSPRAMASMQERLAAERSSLMAKKNLMESERNQAQKELEHREGELEKAKNQHLELEKKLEDLQSKLIVGGVNLLEKAEEQQKLLEQSARDLKVRRKKEASLRQRLQKQEAEHLNMEERYASLQEEAAAKTVQLKAVWKQFQAAKEETADLRSEFQRENEDLLAAVRELSKELKLQVFIIDTHIPKEYQELLQSHAVWDEATGEWHVRGIAYAGNNMRKQPSPELQEEPNILEDTERAYLTYHLSQQLPPSSVPMGTAGATRGAHREKPSAGAGRRRNV